MVVQHFITCDDSIVLIWRAKLLSLCTCTCDFSRGGFESREDWHSFFPSFGISSLTLRRIVPVDRTQFTRARYPAECVILLSPWKRSFASTLCLYHETSCADKWRASWRKQSDSAFILPSSRFLRAVALDSNQGRSVFA